MKRNYFNILIAIMVILSIYLLYVNLDNNSKEDKYHITRYYTTDISGKDTIRKHFLYHKEMVNDSGLRNGKSFDYFDDGSYLIETYKNDTLDGYVKTYYPNGKLAKLIFYKNGLEDGEEFHYNENGIITSYSYNIFGSKCYYVHYDSSGIIDIVKGSPYCKLYTNCLDGLHIDSTFYHGMLMAAPPLYSRQMLAGILDSNGNIIQKPDTLIIKDGKYGFYYKFKSTGIKYWGSEYALKSLINKDSVIRSTYGISFKVYDD